MDLPSSIIEEFCVGREDILLTDIAMEVSSSDHSKFIVIVGVSKDYVAGFFFINSNINRCMIGKQEQLDMQIPMRKSDYCFLRYDSYLCATTIFKVARRKIADSIKKGTTKVKGKMKAEHMTKVLERAKASKLFSKKEKEAFFM